MQSIAPEIAEFRSGVHSAIAVISDETRGTVNEAVTQIDIVKDAVLDATGMFGGTGDGSVDDITEKLAAGFEASYKRITDGLDNTFKQMYNIYNDSDFRSSSPSVVGLQLANGIIIPLDKVIAKFEDVKEEGEKVANITKNIMEDSGLANVEGMVKTGSEVATATVSNLLADHIEKIEEIQQIVDAPDKILDLISNVADMKEVVEILIGGLKDASEKPLKIIYESNGKAEDALFNALKDYISVNGGQVMLNYPVD
jgi:hypothetical protein